MSSGLLRGMRREEVEGVLAHEVSHIANGDMVTMTLIQGVVNAFVMFFARIIANIAPQRRRRDGCRARSDFMTTIVLEIALGLLGSDGRRLVLARARVPRRCRRRDAGRPRQDDLPRCSACSRTPRWSTPSNPSLATMKISGARGWMFALLSTHPPLETRIAALQNG